MADTGPVAGILVRSDPDRGVTQECTVRLEEPSVGYEIGTRSARGNPEPVAEYAAVLADRIITLPDEDLARTPEERK